MDQQTYDREKTLYLYISAVERGDHDQASAILEQAQFDPALEAMIDEAHEEFMRDVPKMELSEEELANIRRKVAEIMGGNNE